MTAELKTGDAVVMTFEDNRQEAVVFFASANHKSIFVIFEGLFLEHLGAMPLLWSENKRAYCDLVKHRAIAITFQVVQ